MMMDQFGLQDIYPVSQTQRYFNDERTSEFYGAQIETWMADRLMC